MVDVFGTSSRPVNLDPFTTRISEVHWSGIEFVRFAVWYEYLMTPATFTSPGPAPPTNTNDGLVDVGPVVDGDGIYGRQGFGFSYKLNNINSVSIYTSGRWVPGGTAVVSISGFPFRVDAPSMTCYEWLYPIQIPQPVGSPWPMYIYAGWPFDTEFLEHDGTGMGGTISDRQGRVVTEEGNAVQYPVTAANSAFRSVSSLNIRSYGAPYVNDALNTYMDSYESSGGSLSAPDFKGQGVAFGDKTLSLSSATVVYKNKSWRPVGAVVDRAFAAVICRKVG